LQLQVRKAKEAAAIHACKAECRAGFDPNNVPDAEVTVDGATVKLTNLQKIFLAKLGLTKRDLLQYYANVSSWLLPHLRNRAMVMKRYPNGINAPPFFFMPHDRIVDIDMLHTSIDVPVNQMSHPLLWLVNLGSYNSIGVTLITIARFADAQKPRRDVRVVLQQVALGQSKLGPENLLQLVSFTVAPRRYTSASGTCSGSKPARHSALHACIAAGFLGFSHLQLQS